MNQEIKQTMKYLKARNFIAYYAENGDQARDTVLTLIPKDMSVGIGDSSSVRQTGVIKALMKRGTPVINPFDPEKPIDDYVNLSKYVFRASLEASYCDVFLTGTNAVTLDGRLVNIDAVGNRVVGMIWGHPMVILIIGKNKIVKDLDAALYRLKHVTAPEHVRRRGAASPCTKKGECQDCLGKTRICNVTTIIEGATFFCKTHVIIVDEDLGLGWDQSWPQGRIDKISDRHNSVMWSMPDEAVKVLTSEELWESVKEYRIKPSLLEEKNG
jgi:hypothetical protein